MLNRSGKNGILLLLLISEERLQLFEYNVSHGLVKDSLFANAFRIILLIQDYFLSHLENWRYTQFGGQINSSIKYCFTDQIFENFLG